MIFRMMLLATALVGLAAGAVSAQADASPVFYRLGDQSTWQQGCFAPCVCPLSEVSPLAGTFWLLPLSGGAEFDEYAVADVQWTATVGNARPRLTGQGVYRVRRTGEPAQQLTLDLQTDGGAVEHFDSGLVASAATLPELDLNVSINGLFCYDTAIRVAAAPAVRATVCRLSKEATWRQDCFGACTCAGGDPAVIGGTCLLYRQDDGSAYATYVLTDIDWTVRTADGPRYITGAGTYQLGGEGAFTQRLQLDLRTNGGSVEHFDSGYVAGSGEFPVIDLVIAASDLVCMDTTIRVTLKPAGDFDLDGAVDQQDFGWFQTCVTAPRQAYVDPACRTADLDDDGDVDQADFGAFQRCITPVGAWMDPACAR